MFLITTDQIPVVFGQRLEIPGPGGQGFGIFPFHTTTDYRHELGEPALTQRGEKPGGANPRVDIYPGPECGEALGMKDRPNLLPVESTVCLETGVNQASISYGRWYDRMPKLSPLAKQRQLGRDRQRSNMGKRTRSPPPAKHMLDIIAYVGFIMSQGLLEEVSERPINLELSKRTLAFAKRAEQQAELQYTRRAEWTAQALLIMCAAGDRRDEVERRLRREFVEETGRHPAMSWSRSST